MVFNVKAFGFGRDDEEMKIKARRSDRKKDGQRYLIFLHGDPDIEVLLKLVMLASRTLVAFLSTHSPTRMEWKQAEHQYGRAFR